MHNNEQIIRTTAGLREVLFQEIESLRAGKSDASRAKSVAQLSAAILQSALVEIAYSKLEKPNGNFGALQLTGPQEADKEPPAKSAEQKNGRCFDCNGPLSSGYTKTERRGKMVFICNDCPGHL